MCIHTHSHIHRVILVLASYSCGWCLSYPVILYWRKTIFPFLAWISCKHFLFRSRTSLSLPWDFCLVWICGGLCVVSESIQVHMCIFSVVPGKCCFLSLESPPLLVLRLLSRTQFPESWGEGFDKNLLFQAECSKVTHCASSSCESLHSLPSTATLHFQCTISITVFLHRKWSTVYFSSTVLATYF